MAARSLTRSITLPQAIALYVGAVVGAGVLILPGVAASTAGPSSLLAWAFDGLLGLPLALTFAFLATRFPDAGGVSTFTSRAFGPIWGGIVGWFYFFAATAGLIIVPLTGGYYVAAAVGWGRTGGFLVAALILMLAIAANLRGLRLSGHLQLLLSGGIVVILLIASVAALPHMEMTRLAPLFPHGLPAFGQAIVLIFFAFFGWEAIAQLSAEFENPTRDIIRSTIWSVALVTLLYLAASLAVVATGTYGNASLDRVALAHVIAEEFGGNTRILTAGVAVLITLGTSNAYAAATSRLGYALGRDRAFPGWMGQLTAHSLPLNALIALGVLTIAGMLLCYFSHWEAEQLFVIPNSLGLATYLIGTAAGVRIMAGWKRVMAATALLLCGAIFPFAGASILLPVGLAIVAYGYQRITRKSKNARIVRI
jgi:amino acid efflux transporter